jgi:glutamine synthetase
MTRPAAIPNHAADPAEVAAFLAANPDITFVDLFFTNLSGVPRGKRLRRHEIEAAYTDGRYLPGSVLVVDITGLDIEESGMVWADGDADRLAWPVPGTLARATWQGADSASAMLGMYDLDGTPCALDPRAILRRVLDRFAAVGLTPVVACELEFYLLDATRTTDGGIQPPPGPDGRRDPHPRVYGIDQLDADAGFLRDLWAACDAMGVPAGAAISEYAPGQFELTLAHKPDALAACDDAVRFKLAAKGCAAARGKVATFMAKPYPDRAGSGLHIHVSVDDEEGDNIFADPALTGTSAMRHAVAGAADLIADGMAIFAPNANSYRRFRRNSYAPVRAGWGLNNRTVPLRIPAGPHTSRRIEHRVSGADANPYLAVAAVLAGMHDGLTRRADPGPPIAGDGYGETGERLPTDWAYAIERFARSAVLADYLGAEAVDMFATVKRVEHERYTAVVTPLDYDWVLRSA